MCLKLCCRPTKELKGTGWYVCQGSKSCPGRSPHRADHYNSHGWSTRKWTPQKRWCQEGVEMLKPTNKAQISFWSMVHLPILESPSLLEMFQRYIHFSSHQMRKIKEEMVLSPLRFFVLDPGARILRGNTWAEGNRPTVILMHFSFSPSHSVFWLHLRAEVEENTQQDHWVRSRKGSQQMI